MERAHFEVFFESISGIYRAVQRLRTAFADKAEVKSVHLFWLYLLHEHPEGMIASQLAQASNTTRSLVSREIKQLIEQEYVRTEETSEKRRYRWNFYLTEKGERLTQQIAHTAMEVQLAASRDIRAEELQVFYRVLSQLHQNFTQISLTGETE